MSQAINDLHKGKFLLGGVVVSGGSLILFSVVRTLLVGVFVCWMHQFPRVLEGEEGVKYFLAETICTLKLRAIRLEMW